MAGKGQWQELEVAGPLGAAVRKQRYERQWSASFLHFSQCLTQETVGHTFMVILPCWLTFHGHSHTDSKLSQVDSGR